MTGSDSSQHYQEIFQQRGHHYNSANALCPAARETERALLLKALDLQEGQILCDVAAGGGYSAEGAVKVLSYEDIVCLEPSYAFAQGLDPRLTRVVGAIELMPLSDRSVDRVSCLAALHHVKDKSAFVRESHRILKPGGILAAADVLDGSSPALFLNGPCDEYSTTGHRGEFFSMGEFTHLLKAGNFGDIRERHECYTWDFPNYDIMVDFCRRLFGLMRGTHNQVRNAIHRYLSVERASNDSVKLHWSLVYVRATKR